MLDGYDSHSLNTAVYFEEELKEKGLPYGSNITVEESFIIKDKAPDLRQDSKTVSFAIAYGGTEHTVSKSLNISLKEAKKIVNNYHNLYKGTYKYYHKFLKEAVKNDYVMTTPHGLKIKCREIGSEDTTVKEGAERSVCNALIQGLSGQLMIKAINRMQKAIEDKGYDLEVQLFLTIHDAIYMRIKDDIGIIKWVNDTIISTIMVEDYKEDQLVHNLAELDIGYNWKDMTTINNFCDTNEIEEVVSELKGRS